MPRGPRLDAPGTLHHVIVRGIERRAIVDDDKDREDFVTRMDRYKWCGHSVIMNRCQSPWQDRRYVLKWFGRKERDAKKSYRGFVKKSILSLAETARQLGISTSGVAQILRRSERV
jgi:hypothetical protein